MADYEDISKGYEPEGRLKSSEKIDALEEARIAIEQFVILKGETVELLPRPPQILSLQVNLAQKYQLQSEIIGLGPESRLRIIPIYTNTNGKQKNREAADAAAAIDEFMHSKGDASGLFSLERLPILPDYP